MGWRSVPFQYPLAALPVPPCSAPLQPPDAPPPIPQPPPPFNASHSVLLASTLLVVLQRPGLPLPQPALGERSVSFVLPHWFKEVSD